MKLILVTAAVAELATGLALVIVPSLVVHLLLGAELSGVALPVARIAGLALIALAIACWPGPPIVGMLAYSTAALLYLGYLGVAFDGRMTGVLLWPAIAVHLAISVLLAKAWFFRTT
jgi:hypothetical protein